MLSRFDAAELTPTENGVPAVRAGGFGFKCQRGRLSRRGVLLLILLRLTERKEKRKVEDKKKAVKEQTGKQNEIRQFVFYFFAKFRETLSQITLFPFLLEKQLLSCFFVQGSQLFGLEKANP